MRDRAENLGDRFRVQRGGIRGDAAQSQTALFKTGVKAPEKRLDIFMAGVVIQNLEKQTLEGAIVDNGQNAEGTVVQFISGDVAGEIAQRPVKVTALHLTGRLFSPRPRPSFGWWPRAQTP